MIFEFEAFLTGTKKPDRIYINLKKQAISISINTFTVYTFDLMGRLITAFRDGHTFRRSLDNRMMEKWSVPADGHNKRQRIWLNLQDRRAVVCQIQEQISKIILLLKKDQFDIVSMSKDDIQNGRQEILNALDKIQYFDFEQLEKEARTFSSIYYHVGILPPDMYLSVLLQATQGCSYNKCSYCNFYKNQPFQIKTETEFHQHIKAVKEYFGEAIAFRKFLFLGEANALDIPQATLVNFFDAINEQFDFLNADVEYSMPAFDGIYSFLTAFHKNKKSAADFAELKAKNLRRVYIGMETGCDELLHFLNKPGKIENVLRLVGVIKQSGVNVGIIILLGAGGAKYSESHTTKTIQVIKEMNLGNGDIIFFSPITNYFETNYELKLKAGKIPPQTKEEIELQRKEMIIGFKFKDRLKAPKMALYDVNEFIY